MTDIILDALLDSLKVFGLSLVLYIILSFFEEKLASLLKKHKSISPILGASVGLIPQCGISVVAADLYLKEHITMGTLFAVFFACSDEALPILLSTGGKAIYVLPLLILKFVFGFLIGYIIDLAVRRKLTEAEAEEVHIGCCHHEIDHQEAPVKEHLLHPLIHSIKIFIYVFIVNLFFGVAIYFIGEENILQFLSQSQWITPLVCALVGLIPNCASSVFISELFILNGIPFGALFTGLCVNAGLGLIYLLKNRKSWKDILYIVILLLGSSILLGYGIIGIMQLFA